MWLPVVNSLLGQGHVVATSVVVVNKIQDSVEDLNAHEILVALVTRSPEAEEGVVIFLRKFSAFNPSRPTTYA